MENIWKDDVKLKKIREAYPTLTAQEFETFVQIGEATGLNPFLREIWAQKYGTSQASIFIGRDGYRKVAQQNADYDYHLTDAVFSNDSFALENGEIKHSYSIKDRGVIVGAYCSVKRKNSSKAIFNYVDFKEYYLGNKDENGKVKKRFDKFKKEYVEMGETLWDTKPATMIKKVAESQCLRMVFQSVFAGTYDESEKWILDDVSQETNENSIDDLLSVWSELWVILCEKSEGNENYKKENENNFLIESLKKIYNKKTIKSLTEKEKIDFIDKCKERIEKESKEIPTKEEKTREKKKKIEEMMEVSQDTKEKQNES